MPYKNPIINKQKCAERWEKWLKNHPEHKEIQKQQVKNYRYKHRNYWMWYNAKRRADSRSIFFNITIKDIIIPEICPVFGIPLYSNTKGGKGAQPNSPTLDRIDVTKGYTKNNIRVISWKANKYKSDMTVSMVEQLLRYMKGEI